MDGSPSKKPGLRIPLFKRAFKMIRCRVAEESLPNLIHALAPARKFVFKEDAPFFQGEFRAQ